MADPGYLDPQEGALNDSVIDWDCPVDNDTFLVNDSSLLRMSSAINFSFVAVYLVMLGTALVANSLAICAAYKGKHRLLYKFCLVSLACSDLMIVSCSGMSQFPKFLQYSYNFWVMGEFLCYFLPFAQTMSVIVNSMIISCIAIDRYLVVTQAISTYWNPSRLACTASLFLIWASSAAVAYPMYGHYMWVTAVAVDTPVDQPCYLFHMCVLSTKEMKNMYFIAVFTIIFLPLFCTFVVLYCLVMRFLWTRRRPGAAKPFIACPDGKAAASSSAAAPGARDSRKTRTVKAILALMVAFVCLRMPSWVFLLYSSGPQRQLTGMGWWLAQNVCSAMVVLNSAINPFFYCFLGQMLAAWDSLRRRLGSLWQDKATASPEIVVTVPREEDKRPSPQAPLTMVPRGPYSVPQAQQCDKGKAGSSTTLTSINSSPTFKGKNADYAQEQDRKS